MNACHPGVRALRRVPVSLFSMLLLALALGGCASSPVDSLQAEAGPVRVEASPPAMAPAPVPVRAAPMPVPEGNDNDAGSPEVPLAMALPAGNGKGAAIERSASAVRSLRSRRAAALEPALAAREPEPPPELVEVSLAHSVPRQMHIGRSYPVELWLDQKLGEAELGRNLALKVQSESGVSPDGTPAKGAGSQIDTGRLVVELGNEVVAELLVFNGEFEVNPAGAVAQPVLANVPLRWQWLVKPLKTGELKLQVRVSARVSGRDSGVTTPYLGSVIVTSWPPANFDELIELLKSWVKQVDSLFALLGTSVAAILAFFFRRGGGDKPTA